MHVSSQSADQLTSRMTVVMSPWALGGSVALYTELKHQLDTTMLQGAGADYSWDTRLRSRTGMQSILGHEVVVIATVSFFRVAPCPDSTTAVNARTLDRPFGRHCKAVALYV